MKKYLFSVILLIIVVFGCGYQAFAKSEPTNIKFIYLNGANNNTPKMQNWFFQGIKKLHPDMKKTFESSDFIRKTFLKNGEYKIDPIPGMFFWGDKSISDLENVDEKLISLSMFSPKIAQMFRTFFAHCIHDAIWVQKDHNMQPIVNDLHKEVLTVHSRGEKSVLFGYSAGSFITYEYLFYKLPALNNKNLLELVDFNDKQREFVSENPVNGTCLDALISSKLLIFSTNGSLIPTSDFNEFRKIYRQLNGVTSQVCTPEGALLGIINYASPIVLFYSDNIDPSIEINKYNQYIYKYMISKDMFTITVNFADDPLGYPLTKNLTPEDLEQMYNFKFEDGGSGFMHDKSDVKSPATFLGAHTSYWKYSKKFSKAVRDAYKDGYLNFNSDGKI